MEMILDIFWEKRKAYLEWRQAACAVILALLLAGLCRSAGGQADLAGEHMGTKTLPLTVSSSAAGRIADMAALPGEKLSVSETAAGEIRDEANAGIIADGQKAGTDPGIAADSQKTGAYAGIAADSQKDRAYPASAAGEENYAVSYGGTGDTQEETGSRANRVSGGSVSAAKNRGRYADSDGKASVNSRKASGKIRAVVQRADKKSGKTAGTVADIPAAGGFAGNKGILSDGKAVTPAVGLERFPGFLSDAKGHITGYTDASKFMKDHLVVFPVNKACTGIEKGALKGLEGEIFEIYIPANITYIAPGAFDDLTNLYYIEAAGENSAFYSDNGILYYRNGKVAACPGMLK